MPITFAARAAGAIEWRGTLSAAAQTHPSILPPRRTALARGFVKETSQKPEILQTTFVAIPAGWFMMGCASGRDEERPVHRVWVDSFDMAALQVRRRDWAEFMEATGHAAPPNWAEPDFNHPDQPVVSVSWHEAAKYCDWLSAQSGRNYRLPTEAEWERAARGGRENELYVWGDTSPGEWSGYV